MSDAARSNSASSNAVSSSATPAGPSMAAGQAPVQVVDAPLVYRRLLGYARPHLGMFSIGVLGMALFASTDAAIAYLVQRFLGGAFVEPDPRILWASPLGASGLCG